MASKTTITCDVCGKVLTRRCPETLNFPRAPGSELVQLWLRPVAAGSGYVPDICWWCSWREMAKQAEAALKDPLAQDADAIHKQANQAVRRELERREDADRKEATT